MGVEVAQSMLPDLRYAFERNFMCSPGNISFLVFWCPGFRQPKKRNGVTRLQRRLVPATIPLLVFSEVGPGRPCLYSCASQYHHHVDRGTFSGFLAHFPTFHGITDSKSAPGLDTRKMIFYVVFRGLKTLRRGGKEKSLPFFSRSRAIHFVNLKRKFYMQVSRELNFCLECMLESRSQIAALFS